MHSPRVFRRRGLVLSGPMTARRSLGHLQAALLGMVLSVAIPAIATEPQAARATPAQVGMSPERLARLDDYMKRQVASGHLPGAVTLLARHGRIVAFNSYGEADPERHVAMTRDAVFRIYSQTKVVTAVAMLLLFEEGRWHFDDPVTKFLPELKSLRVFTGLNADGSLQLADAVRPATLRELLTHSAGFGYGLSEDNPVDLAYSRSQFLHAASSTDAIERIAKLPLASQPGLHWRYSAAVDLQGYIVERISGQSLADFMQQRIFGPLHMIDTGFYVPASKLARLVVLKTYDPATHSLIAPSGPLMFDYSKPPGAASGGAGLVSTASDYLRFAQMLLNGGQLDGVRILAPGTVKLLAANLLADDIRAKADEPFSQHTGLGFGANVAVVLNAAQAGTLEGEGSYSWGGAAGTWFWIDPRNDLIFLGMMQVMERWKDPQLHDIDSDTSALVYGALVSP
jgi:CubicO group peptidase (beta-lactamase class C family)